MYTYLVFMLADIYIYVNRCMHIYIYMYTYLVFMLADIYIYVNRCMHIYIYIYVCILTWFSCWLGCLKLTTWSHSNFPSGLAGLNVSLGRWCHTKEECQGEQPFLCRPFLSLDSWMGPHNKIALCQIWLRGKSDKSYMYICKIHYW